MEAVAPSDRARMFFLFVSVLPGYVASFCSLDTIPKLTAFECDIDIEKD